MLKKLFASFSAYTKTDLRSLGQSAFWILAGNFATRALGLVLAIIFANFVSKETYGTYRYILSIAATLLIFTLTGVTTSVIRSVALGFEGVIKKAYALRVRASFLGSIGAAIVGIYYALHGNRELGFGMFIVAALFPLFDPPTIYGSFLNGKKLFRADALADAFVTIGYTIVMAIAVLLTKNVLVLVAVYFTIHILLRTVVYRYVLLHYKANHEIDPYWRSYGIHLSFNDILTTIANYIDKIILFNVAGPIDLAVYSFASAFPEQLKIFHSFIPIVGFPKWSVVPIEDLKRTLPRKLLIFFLESVLLIIMYILIAPTLFKLFFPAYLVAIPASQIYMLSFLNFAPSFILPILQAQSRVRELYIFNTTSSILQIILLLFGGIFYGLWGIVIARVLGRIGMTIIALLCYRSL